MRPIYKSFLIKTILFVLIATVLTIISLGFCSSHCHYCGPESGFPFPVFGREYISGDQIINYSGFGMNLLFYFILTLICYGVYKILKLLTKIFNILIKKINNNGYQSLVKKGKIYH